MQYIMYGPLSDAPMVPLLGAISGACCANAELCGGSGGVGSSPTLLVSISGPS